MQRGRSCCAFERAKPGTGVAASTDVRPRKIAVAVDFSTESLAALEHALSLAERTGAEIVLLHAGFSPETPERIPGVLHSSYTRYAAQLAEEMARDERRLDALRAKLETRGRVVSHILVHGRADTALAEAADELGADLLVAGTHGRTGVKRFLLGSVAERVVRLTPTSVMIARGTPPDEGYRSILVPTDFTPQAALALATAVELAPTEARLELVHAWQLPAMYTAYYTPGGNEEIRAEYAVEVNQRGAELRASIERKDLSVHFLAIEGAAAHTVAETIDRRRPELVVMGSHSRRGVSRFVLGSVAERTVRHASCSVMVVREPPRAHRRGARARD